MDRRRREKKPRRHCILEPNNIEKGAESMVVMFDIETTGLEPYENKVVLIGMKRMGSIRQWKLWEMKDEAKVISEALQEIEKENDTIVGYNNLKFDVPFMMERLRILGKWRREYYQIYSKKWFDLYQYLGNDYRSLALWSRRAGIRRENPELKGEDMPSFFQKGEFDKIEKHNRDDLNTSQELFKFLKKNNPELIPF
jgi:uncharacterized protein YprB with RNaseH-like and TPR domain